MATSLNGKPSRCEIRGCHARVHGRGLCRVHYDQARYFEATRRNPEALEAAQREEHIRAELRLGCVAEWRSPHGTNSMFATDEQRREAWEARRDEIMAEALTPPLTPGHRPAAWWDYEAGREHHLTEDPIRFKGTEDEEAAALDEYETEPVIWLAEHGHLTEAEIEKIREEADVARPRIGTEFEHIGSCGVDRADRRAARLWEAVERALRADEPAA